MRCGVVSETQNCARPVRWEVRFGGKFDVLMCDEHLAEFTRVVVEEWKQPPAEVSRRVRAARLTFREWLERQRDRNDPVGDIARDVDNDGCSLGDDPDAMLAHIESAHRIVDAASHAFDRAADEWRSSGRALEA
jgi:hypothetical protein